MHLPSARSVALTLNLEDSLFGETKDASRLWWVVKCYVCTADCEHADGVLRKCQREVSKRAVCYVALPCNVCTLPRECASIAVKHGIPALPASKPGTVLANDAKPCSNCLLVRGVSCPSQLWDLPGFVDDIVI